MQDAQKEQAVLYLQLTGITRSFIVKCLFSSFEGFQCRITTDTMLTTRILSFSCAVNLNMHFIYDL